MDEHEFNISTLERKLEALKGKEEATRESQPVWKRFGDLLSQMSDDQRLYVDANSEVIGKRQKMMQAFNDWLFEKHKDEFAAIPAFSGFAQEYVEAVASTAREFGQKAAGLQKENEELRRQLAELQKRGGGDVL